MKLWKLTPRHDSIWWCQEGKDPWHPHHDRAFGFIVRAADAGEARWLAHQGGGDENHALDGVQPWLNENYSSCEELPPAGNPGVVLVNFRHGP